MNKLYNDPLELYIRQYRQQFADAAADFIKNAIATSGIDIADNAAMVKAVKKLIDRRNRAETKRCWLIILLILAAIVLAAVIIKWYSDNQVSFGYKAAVVAYSAIVLLLFFTLIPKIRNINSEIENLRIEIAESIASAKEKLLPFFSQFDWNTLTGLIEKVLPDLKFDDFLTSGRVYDMLQNFDLPKNIFSRHSIVCTHSGTFAGYPFIFAEHNEFEFQDKVYYGNLTIHWTEWVTDANGNKKQVEKSETLTASVTKPVPVVVSRKHLLFGHSAAPHLSFSRVPSSLSGAEDGIFTSIGKKIKMSKLRKFEQNLTDDSNYTMMSNKDFELLFCSTDRDHEVEYRLIFTPLAQQNMVNLLNDNAAGYGDDFVYRKRYKLTELIPEHLQHTPFSTDPAAPDEYDFSIIARNMEEHYNEFFRSIYFAFAPVFAIPAYNEPRIDTPDENENISSWELEGIANYHGDEYYKHPQSITGNLLKVGQVNCRNGVYNVSVTAHGFRGEERIELVPVRGSDNRTHRVEVPWVEYLPVSRNTAFQATRGTAQDAEENGGIYRRSIISVLPER